MIINIIQFIHFILVLGVISSVFVPNYELKKYAFVFMIFIFIQYITNYGKCGLTELEYIFKGQDYQEGFIYRIVKPIITIPEKYFENYLYLIHITWTLVLGLQLTNNYVYPK
jgi:hypothetical protein